MNRYDRKIVIIQPGTAQMRIFKIESSTLDEVKFSPGYCGQTNGVSRIPRNFGGIEKNLEHVPQCTAHVSTERDSSQV